MGYLRCEACGAKALSAASTCPSCAAPFSVHDGRGTRVALKRCSGCGIMHRRDRSCHWCGEQRSVAWRSPMVLRSATGVAAVALVAIGSWIMRDRVADVISVAYAAVNSSPVLEAKAVSIAQLQTAAVDVVPPTAEAPVAAQPTGELQGEPRVDGVLMGTAAGAIAVVDSILWVPAVATTWVNVRRDASRDGDVVGIIRPSEKAMLGVGRSRWRQLKSPEFTGWVDGSLFAADSARTRG